MTKFMNLRYKNILSTGNTFNTIDFTKSKTTLVMGKNGEGKSTFLDALTYVLFGKPFRKINKPQLINVTNTSELLCELELKTQEGDEYLIRRGMKPNVFEIHKNNVLIPQDSLSKDYQEYLESSILKMNYKSFTQIVVIGSATYTQFMKLSTYDRRNIIENLLDIDIFTKMNVLLKTSVTQVKEEISDVSYKLDLSKEKIKLQNNSSNSERSLLDQINENKKEIEKYNKQIQEKAFDIEVLQKKLENLFKENNKIETLNKKLNSLNKYNNSFLDKIKRIEKEIAFFEENDICPTCTQEINSEFSSNLVKKIQEDKIKFSSAVVDCEKQIENIKEEIVILDKLKVESSNILSEITNLKFQKETLHEYITKLESQNNSLMEKLSFLRNKSDEEMRLLKEENTCLSKEREDLLNKQHLQSIATILLKDDGIKTKIVRHYLPIMNRIINKYLQMMDFYLSFTLNENFEEVIKNKAKESFSYESFSEGEKLRIDLAILFTWREISKMKNCASTNLLICDEILDNSMDASGVEDFIKIISSSKETESINTFIISHRGDNFIDKFERILRVEKIAGFSKIKEEMN